MKTTKKILIAVCAVVLAAAVIVGVLVAVFSRKAPELQKEKLRENPINKSSIYLIAQPPYTDNWIFDTPIGMHHYWTENYNYAVGMEVVLQQSKDGELIVLSEPLPANSNADDLYGKDVSVGDLTLAELRKLNLAYDLVDEDGFQSYVGLTGAQLAQYSVMTLDEAFTAFEDPIREDAKYFLRFYDETKIADLSAAVQAIRDGLAAHGLTEKTVFLPQSDESAAAADKDCPEMMRAATSAEAKALLRDCKADNTPDELPYAAVYEKADGQFGSERFIHYVRNLGLVIVLTDVDENDVVRYYEYGASALATSNAPTFSQLLKDAKKAERESRKAAG